MNREEALRFLKLETTASETEIQQRIEASEQKLNDHINSAATDALKAKYEQGLAQLHEAKAALQTSGPSQSSSPLSQTKMHDLPGMAASHTQAGFADSSAVPIQIGQVLADRYRVEALLGSGGMGAVYRANDANTGEAIALKVLLPALLNNERARERFMDEARISQKLSHPHIVNVFDVQQDGEFYFLTMELLEGQDLRQVMENRKLSRQPFAEKELIEIATQLCSALQYAHQYTVHRDIKPENIWLTEQGQYKIMDFGIARVQSTSQRTQTGAAMGTAYYMAPEQLKGQKNIDGRADQYALGVMMYELATGDVPAGVIKPVSERRRDLSKGFARAVMTCLHATPEDRFENIESFLQALTKKGGAGITLPWKSIGIAAAILLAVVGIGGLFGSGIISKDSLSGLLPKSREELATEKADLARLQGEIRSLQKKLENSRRNLDSEVRDAERNNLDELASLTYWQRVTEDFIFEGSTLTDLEGQLAMAETLMRDEAFEQAKPVFNTVRNDMENLVGQFEAGRELYELREAAELAVTSMQQEKGKNENVGQSQAYDAVVSGLQESESLLAQGNLIEAGTKFNETRESAKEVEAQYSQLLAMETQANGVKNRWLQAKQKYSLQDPEFINSAETAETEARRLQQEGMVSEAIEKWTLADEQWQAVSGVYQSRITEAETAERERQAVADKAERERLAVARKRKAVIDELVASVKEWEDARNKFGNVVIYGSLNYQHKNNYNFDLDLNTNTIKMTRTGELNYFEGNNLNNPYSKYSYYNCYSTVSLIQYVKYVDVPYDHDNAKQWNKNRWGDGSCTHKNTTKSKTYGPYHADYILWQAGDVAKDLTPEQRKLGERAFAAEKRFTRAAKEYVRVILNK